MYEMYIHSISERVPGTYYDIGKLQVDAAKYYQDNRAEIDRLLLEHQNDPENDEARTKGMHRQLIDGARALCVSLVINYGMHLTGILDPFLGFPLVILCRHYPGGIKSPTSSVPCERNNDT